MIFSTWRPDFAPPFVIFTEKSTFFTSKYRILGTKGRMMLIFDSGEISDQTFSKNKISEKGGQRGGTYLHLNGHHGYAQKFKNYPN